MEKQGFFVNKFKALFDQLKDKEGFKSGDLTAEKLNTALGQETVKTAIKELLEKEFGVTGITDANSQISVSPEGSNKVTVTITGTQTSGTHNGFSTVKKNDEMGIPQDIEIELLLKKVDDANEEKAEKIVFWPRLRVLRAQK